jgi:hypothetical protein
MAPAPKPKPPRRPKPVSDVVIVAAESVARLTKDLKDAARTLKPDEARFLVDYYYLAQAQRIRSANQVRALHDSGEPHALVSWVEAQTGTLERQVRQALDVYSDASITGRWSKGVRGIAEVIAAGLLAHIDITKAPTSGPIWRFMGMDPTIKWLGKEGAAKLIAEKWQKGLTPEENLVQLATSLGRRSDSLLRQATNKDGKVTKATVEAAFARRPWNADLKVLGYHIGESFVKVSNHPDAFYGHLWRQRKEIEVRHNEEGRFRDEAVRVLATKRIGKTTAAYAAYSQGKLPPDHVHARAKRWVVKLFMSHWQQVRYREHFGRNAPNPYVLDILGHTDRIQVPGWPFPERSPRRREHHLV